MCLFHVMCRANVLLSSYTVWSVALQEQLADFKGTPPKAVWCGLYSHLGGGGAERCSVIKRERKKPKWAVTQVCHLKAGATPERLCHSAVSAKNDVFRAPHCVR